MKQSIRFFHMLGQVGAKSTIFKPSSWHALKRASCSSSQERILSQRIEFFTTFPPYGMLFFILKKMLTSFFGIRIIKWASGVSSTIFFDPLLSDILRVFLFLDFSHHSMNENYFDLFYWAKSGNEVICKRCY